MIGIFFYKNTSEEVIKVNEYKEIKERALIIEDLKDHVLKYIYDRTLEKKKLHKYMFTTIMVALVFTVIVSVAAIVAILILPLSTSSFFGIAIIVIISTVSIFQLSKILYDYYIVKDYLNSLNERL